VDGAGNGREAWERFLPLQTKPLRTTVTVCMEKGVKEQIADVSPHASHEGVQYLPFRR